MTPEILVQWSLAGVAAGLCFFMVVLVGAGIVALIRGT